eukprot:360822-Chlamydomonas_euryale.AAC.1
MLLLGLCVGQTKWQWTMCPKARFRRCADAGCPDAGNSTSSCGKRGWQEAESRVLGLTGGQLNINRRATKTAGCICEVLVYKLNNCQTFVILFGCVRRMDLIPVNLQVTKPGVGARRGWVSCRAAGDSPPALLRDLPANHPLLRLQDGRVPPLFAVVRAEAGGPGCCLFLVPVFEQCVSPGVAPA